MDNQTEFIARIKGSLTRVGNLSKSTQSLVSEYETRDDAGIFDRINKRSPAEFETLAEIFEENARPLNLHTHRAESPEELAETILQLVETTTPEFHEEKQIVLHDCRELSELQLAKRLADKNVTVHTTSNTDIDIREKTLASYIGITVPDLGVADGAAVLHFTGPGCPRSTSLIPSIHVAVVKQERLVADLTEAYGVLAAQKDLPNSLVFISGPSKTADIEAHLVHGAHGPREMHVVITTY